MQPGMQIVSEVPAIAFPQQEHLASLVSHADFKHMSRLALQGKTLYTFRHQRL